MKSNTTYHHTDSSICNPVDDTKYANKYSIAKIRTANPNYAILNNRVFTANKLASLIKESMENTSSDCQLSTEDMIELVSKSWVDPIVAVEQWGVVPEPYTVVYESNGFRILHQAFNAVIPEVYNNDNDLNRALAHLLSGGIIGSKGEFSYKGQFLTLFSQPFPPELPPQPVLEIDDLAVPDHCTSYLLNTSYEQGFTPLTQTEFNRVKSLEVTWRDISAAVSLFVESNESDLWSAASSFHLERIDHPDKYAIDGSDSDVILLRKYYPELSAMSSHSLYNWFGDYQGECRYSGSVVTNRDSGYLRYLLGQLASGGTLRGMSAIDVGTFTAFAFLGGANSDTALKLGLECHSYQRAIELYASRIASIMHFLQTENTAGIVICDDTPKS